jgi:hypothetical protein
VPAIAIAYASDSKSCELEDERDHEQRHLRAATADVPELLQVVRRDLTTGGREDLHDPEQNDDLWHLDRDRCREELPDDGQLAIGVAPAGARVCPRRSLLAVIGQRHRQP